MEDYYLLLVKIAAYLVSIALTVSGALRIHRSLVRIYSLKQIFIGIIYILIAFVIYLIYAS